MKFFEVQNFFHLVCLAQFAWLQIVQGTEHPDDYSVPESELSVDECAKRANEGSNKDTKSE